MCSDIISLKHEFAGCLADSEERAALDLGVISLSPMLGEEMTLINKTLKHEFTFCLLRNFIWGEPATK